MKVAVGGNIGTPILSLSPPSACDRVHVIECSSFQIDLAPSLDPSVGVLLNVTPDHLDRHGTMENYAAVKERLVAARRCRRRRDRRSDHFGDCRTAAAQRQGRHLGDRHAAADR